MPRSSLIKYRSVFVSRHRSRWRLEEARAVIERMRASGLPVAEFAAKEGLDPQRLYRWRARLNAPAVDATEFVEVTAAVRPAPIEVVLRTGDVLRVPPTFNEDALRRVLAVLDQRVASQC